MTRQELINQVKTKVDELSPPDGEIVSFNLTRDKPIDTFADNLLDECAREVLMKAPAFRLPATSGTVSAVQSPGGTAGAVPVPADFLRLLEFKMKEWERPVCAAYEAGSDMAQRQHNPFTRGGCCKPVCVLAHRHGSLYLEYYSVRNDHTVEHFLYVKETPAEDLPPGLQDVLTWWCAARLLEISGKQAESQMAWERGKTLL